MWTIRESETGIVAEDDVRGRIAWGPIRPHDRTAEALAVVRAAIERAVRSNPAARAVDIVEAVDLAARPLRGQIDFNDYAPSASTRETAHHEAGHVVAARAIGMRVLLATVDPRVAVNGAGCVRVDDEDRARLERNAEGCARVAMFQMAGPEAARRFANVSRPEWCDDESKAGRLTGIPPYEAGGSAEHARVFVHEPARWRAIERFARELLAAITLEGDELERALERTEGGARLPGDDREPADVQRAE